MMRKWSSRRRAGVAGTFLLGAVMVVGTASTAYAHATYKSSDPADKSTVSSPPSNITAEFTEPMTGGSYMDVTDPCGRDSGTGSSQTGSSMSVQNTSGAAGTYTVYWRAASIDGHVTEGEFTFTATGGDPCPGEEVDDDPVDPGGGGGGGGNGSGGGDGGGSSSGDGAVAGSGSGHNDHSKMKHANHGRNRGNKTTGDKNGGGAPESGDEIGPQAGSPTDPIPDAPSALDGIPIDGLLLTFAVAALIGAAAGKIYVSLSGDGS